MITASSAALAGHCQHSFRLDAPKPPEPPTNEEQARGNLVGALSEAYINGTPPPEWNEFHGAPATRMWLHLSDWLKENKRLGWKAEAAFIYDPVADVAREIPRGKHRDYSAATEAETCAATLDIVSIEGTTLVVRDIKTHVPGAPHHSADAQLEWCGLFAARAWGFDEVRIETLVVTETGLSVEGVRTLDLFDLADIRAGIQATLAKVPTSQPEPGEWCAQRYCKLLTTCDRGGRGAPAALAQVIPTESLVRYQFTTEILDVDHAIMLHEVAALAQKRVDEVKAAVKAYVGDKVLTDSTGQEIRATFRQMPREDRKELVALVKRLGGTDEDLMACVHPKTEPAGLRVKAAPKLLKGKR